MSRQSSTADDRESTGADSRTDAPERRRGWWGEPGLTPRSERIATRVAVVVLVVLVIAWTWSISRVRSGQAAEVAGGTRASGAVATALSTPNAPTTTYLTDAALGAAVDRALRSARGASGKLEARMEPAPGGLAADTLPPGGHFEYSRNGLVAREPRGAGIWNVLLRVGDAVRPVANFNLISTLPFSAKRDGRIGLYYVGTWPSEKGRVGPRRAPAGAYGNPRGFIEVTKANADTRVSEHFRLRDFLTHDQPNVWPKYLVLQSRLVDKLELVLSDLQERGIDTRGVRVMSGFRTPQYNYTGGNTGGRASLSRHMYGDAADVYIDNDGDGQMDDLDHDGRITIGDARVISAAVDRVDAAHPELVGGAGVYTAAPGHGPFIHIDTRGYRARWVGTSGG